MLLLDNDADKSGLVYKVEMNDKKQISKITSMDGGKPIDVVWVERTLGGHGAFATVAMEYQDGYVKYSFKNEAGEATEGNFDAYSIRYEYDDKKKNVSMAYLYSKDGEPFDGIAQLLFTYDDKGQLEEIGFAHSNGERFPFRTRLKYDSNHKTPFPVEVALYDMDGSLITNGYGAKTSYAYDEKGRLTEVRHFGTDEKLKIIDAKDMQGFKYGRKPTMHSFGAITKYTYEGDGRDPVKVAFFGTDEQPLAINEKFPFASLVYTYTEEGRIASVSTWGIDDMLSTEKGEDVAKLAYSYDSYGNVISMTSYGKYNNVVTLFKDTQFAICKNKYDDKRRETETAYFGTDGNPVNREVVIDRRIVLYHREVYEYDDGGKRIKEIYYDKDGKKVGQIKP